MKDTPSIMGLLLIISGIMNFYFIIKVSLLSKWLKGTKKENNAYILRNLQNNIVYYENEKISILSTITGLKRTYCNKNKGDLRVFLDRAGDYLIRFIHKKDDIFALVNSLTGDGYVDVEIRELSATIFAQPEQKKHIIILFEKKHNEILECEEQFRKSLGMRFMEALTNPYLSSLNLPSYFAAKQLKIMKV